MDQGLLPSTQTPSPPISAVVTVPQGWGLDGATMEMTTSEPVLHPRETEAMLTRGPTGGF